MKRDSLYGPPKEMFNTKSKMKEKRRRMKHGSKSKNDNEQDEFSEDEFALNEMDDGKQMALLRKYEVNKLKYFYAIVTCDTKRTANSIVAEYDNFEFELTNMRLSLSLVPDET